MTFTLTIFMFFAIGLQGNVQFDGTVLYPTLEACEKDGLNISNWLTQDFVTVQYTCEGKE